MTDLKNLFTSSSFGGGPSNLHNLHYATLGKNTQYTDDNRNRNQPQNSHHLQSPGGKGYLNLYSLHPTNQNQTLYRQTNQQTIGAPQRNNEYHHQSQNPIRPQYQSNNPQFFQSNINNMLMRTASKQLSKTTVDNPFMYKQLKAFNNIISLEVIFKYILIFFFLAGIKFSGKMTGGVFFELSILVAVVMWQRSGSSHLRIMDIFLYCAGLILYAAVVYDVLLGSGRYLEDSFAIKQASQQENIEQNTEQSTAYSTSTSIPTLLYYAPFILSSIPHIFWTIICFSIHILVIQKLQHILFAQKLTEISVPSEIIEHIKHYTYKLWNHVKNVFKLWKPIMFVGGIGVLTGIVMCLLAGNSFDYKLRIMLSLVNLSLIAKTITTFWLMEWVIFSVKYVSDNVISWKLAKKKIHNVEVFMQLLRLKTSYKGNAKIQDRCILELIKRTKKHSEFLKTPVNFNHALNEYGDIFEIFYTSRIRSILSLSNDLSIELLYNLKITQRNKRIIDDLFIWFRKLSSCVKIYRASLKLIQILQQNKLMMLMLVKASTECPLKQEGQELLQNLIIVVKKFEETLRKVELIPQQMGRKALSQRLVQWNQQLQVLSLALSKSTMTKVSGKLSETSVNGWREYTY